MKEIPAGIIGQTFDGYEIEVFIEHNGVTGIFIGTKDNVYRILKIALIEEGRALILHEESLLKQLQHPGVIPLITRIDVLGLPALVFYRYTRGTLLQNIHSCTVEHIESILQSLLHTVEFLSKKKIVHSDIKLENILLDDAGRPILIDFGASKIEDRENERFTGTVEYSAPEVLRTPYRFSKESDMYSVGVCIYFLLFKKYPSIQPSNEWIDIPLRGCGMSQKNMNLLCRILQYNPKLRMEDIPPKAKEAALSKIHSPKTNKKRSSYISLIIIVVFIISLLLFF